MPNIRVIAQTSTAVAITEQPSAHVNVFYGKGDRGKSAYEIAVSNGFIGTEQQWLDSIDGGLAVAEHVADPTPHAVYDDIQSLELLFENGLI